MDIIFNDWVSLGRILLASVLAYFSLVLLLRISGNRTLSKMNAFDLVVTVALGSTLSSGILQKSVTVADTVMAFSALIGLQYIVTWLSVRSHFAKKVFKSEPGLLFCNGQFLRHAMKRARVTEEEIRAAARNSGHLDLTAISGIVLETNGELSVWSRGGIQCEN